MVCGGGPPFPLGRGMLWAEWQLVAVQLNQRAAGGRAASEKAWGKKSAGFVSSKRLDRREMNKYWCLATYSDQ